MKRTAATFATTVALTVAALTPATATTVTNPTPGYHGQRPPVVVPLCVTTSWRAAHTGHRKTRPGEVCQVRAGMWIPRTWHRVGVVYSRDGANAYELWQRPVVSHTRCVTVPGAPGSGIVSVTTC